MIMEGQEREQSINLTVVFIHAKEFKKWKEIITPNLRQQREIAYSNKSNKITLKKTAR